MNCAHLAKGSSFSMSLNCFVTPFPQHRGVVQHVPADVRLQMLGCLLCLVESSLWGQKMGPWFQRDGTRMRAQWSSRVKRWTSFLFVAAAWSPRPVQLRSVSTVRCCLFTPKYHICFIFNMNWTLLQNYACPCVHIRYQAYHVFSLLPESLMIDRRPHGWNHWLSHELCRVNTASIFAHVCHVCCSVETLKTKP